MITREELIDYAKLKNLNLGQAELDYIQNLILYVLSNHGKEIIFKGGTALYKAYNLDRFSEDLDFTITSDFKIKENVEEVIKSLNNFGLNGKIKQKTEFENSVKFILRFEGPLYKNISVSQCKINLDFSLREEVLLNPDLIKINHILNEIPLYSFFVMNPQEMLAEKIRAIMTRKKARDIYDLNYLLKRQVKFDENLVNKKLRFYNLDWNKKLFFDKLKEKEDIWERELKPIVPNIPSFKPFLSEIKRSFK